MSTTNYFTGNGTQTEFDLSIDTSNPDSIVVKVGGVSAAYTWISVSRISINPAPAVGAEIEISRETDIDNAAVNFENNAVLLAEDLNEATQQIRYAVQELRSDVVNISERTFKAPVGENSPPLPSAADRANKLLTFDNDGSPSVEYDVTLLTGALVSGGSVPAQTVEFVATAGQTVFNFPAPAAIGFVSVFLNGVKLKATDFVHSGTTVTLGTGAALGDTVTLEGFTQSAVPDLTSLPLLAAEDGAGRVGFKQVGTGAVARAAQDELRETVKVTQFTGANDTAVINAALAAHAGKRVVVPYRASAYSITSKITIPASTTLVFERGVSTTLAFNGDAFELLHRSYIEGLNLTGSGATYAAGRGVVVNGTNGKNGIKDCVITGTGGPALEFLNKEAGSGFFAVNSELERYNSASGTGRYAVVLPAPQQLAAVPRAFVGLRTNGACSIDFGGSNDTFVSHSFLADLAFSDDTRGLIITASRWANQATCTLRGHGISIQAIINPTLTIAPTADNINLEGSVYNSIPVIDASGNNRNFITHAPVSYTPTLTSGGTAPVLGNGTLTGQASRSGSTVRVTIELTIGTTTALGTGGLKFSLPTWAPNTNAFVQITGDFFLNRGGTIYAAFGQIVSATQTLDLYRDTSGAVTFNSPATWAPGDTFRGSFEYQL